MTLFNTIRCLLILSFLFSTVVKGQHPPSNKLIDGKTQKQIVEEYASWSKIKNDWANLTRYQKENALLSNSTNNDNRVIFMGDSITESWKVDVPAFFENKNYINRGISGQTTPQMLLRFRQDVINLSPKVIVLLAGTNDIAGNTGKSTLEMIENNIYSMIDLAQSNGITVILCSLLPANKYPWFPEQRPADKIYVLNEKLKSYAIKHQIHFVDYYQALVDHEKGLPLSLSHDGVHPNKKGYAIMGRLLNKKINILLNSKK